MTTARARHTCMHTFILLQFFKCCSLLFNMFLKMYSYAFIGVTCVQQLIYQVTGKTFISFSVVTLGRPSLLDNKASIIVQHVIQMDT